MFTIHLLCDMTAWNSAAPSRMFVLCLPFMARAYRHLSCLPNTWTWSFSSVWNPLSHPRTGTYRPALVRCSRLGSSKLWIAVCTIYIFLRQHNLRSPGHDTLKTVWKTPTGASPSTGPVAFPIVLARYGVQLAPYSGAEDALCLGVHTLFFLL